jgi:hypothetical protein
MATEDDSSLAQPLGPRRLDLTALSPDDFELLCAWVVAISHPDAMHVANPDGGADTALRRDEGGWQRCWQAKRFTGSIKWPQCKESLDDAVKTYDGITHYTFCFARNLTVNQEKLFEKHLIGRCPGVKVDHWNQSRIELALFSTPQGERIVRHFFGDPAIDTRALMRALRASGSLETGEDVLDRLAAVAEHIAAGDPLYQYVQVSTEADGPLPGLTPATLIAMHTVIGDAHIRIDAVPRNPSLLESPPGGKVYLTDAQAEQFARFRARGGDLQLDGVRVDFENMPSLFEQLAASDSGDMTLQFTAPAVLPHPWHARFNVIGSDIDFEPFEVLLEPILDIDPEWDSGLVGTVGGFTIRVLFRANAEGGGVMNFGWSWRDDATRSATERLREVFRVAALTTPGRLVVDDVRGERPQAQFELHDERLDDEMYGLMAFLYDLAALEEWTGDTITPIGVVPADEVRAVHDVAKIVRTGESPMNFEQVSLSLPPDKIPEPRPEGHQLVVEVTTGVVLRGSEILVGKLRGELTDVNVEIGETDELGNTDVRIKPATDEARHPVFRLRRFTAAELARERSEP